jgi:chromosome segregation ATPase
MYYALGLLSAGLVVLLVTPLIWRRATRLVRARVESSVPMSLTEIQAEKDHLRAEFAVVARRLELTADRLKAANAEQAVEISRQREFIARLSTDDTGKEGKLAAKEAEAADLAARLRAAEEQLAALKTSAAEDRKARERSEAALADASAAADELQVLSDEQKVEIAARATESASLTSQLEAARAVVASLSAERDTLSAALAEERTKSAAENIRAESLTMAETRLQAELAESRAAGGRREPGTDEEQAERERLTATIARLTAERDAKAEEAARQAKALAEIEGAMGAEASAQRDLQIRLAAAEAEIAALEARIATVTEGDNLQKAIAATEAHNAALSERLAALESENARLTQENRNLEAIAGGNFDRFDYENGLLREKLAGVANAVLRLGETSGNGAAVPRPADPPGREAKPAPRPTPVIAAVTETPAEAAAPGSDAPPKPIDARSLAERLRALQQTSAQR